MNGEAIHATEASPFPRRLPWGRATHKTAANGATTLYLHVWDWPADGKLLLPALQELPVSGKMLNRAAAVTATRTDAGVTVHLPTATTDADVSVVRLDFPGPLTITQQPFVVPAADGTITLLATDADTHGGLSGNIHLKGTGADAWLSDWTSPDFRIEYQIKTGKAGKWRVEAEVASPHPARLILCSNKIMTPAEIPATGPDLSWQKVKLGSIELPAGEAVLEIKAVKDDWKGINLRKLHLLPE